ncbi:hypothetical protein CRE_11345 [Caenorhabditis remanei]|uniref:Uncharacterized protein n=1 Tax=Caenorhabditis remanei TaxID=31234 RepID=E3N0F8_CAERE|nr:hypothetical protein CRE_11345 [Caenorhabditis remanei]
MEATNKSMDALFKVGEKFVCLYENTTPYQAKVTAIRVVRGVDNYNVHYISYGKRHDELVPFGEEEGKMFKGTLEDYQRNHNIPPAEAMKNIIIGNPPKAGGAVEKAGPSSRKPGRPKKGKEGEQESTDPCEPSTSTEEPTHSVCLKVELPPGLLKVLGEDHSLLGKDFIPELPVTHSIDTIIREYLAKMEEDEQRELTSIKDGDSATREKKKVLVKYAARKGAIRSLVEYFNASLNNFLLTEKERLQHSALLRREATKKNVRFKSVLDIPTDTVRFSEHYGIVHMVRMLTKLDELLQVSDWNDYFMEKFMDAVHDFMGFLEDNYLKYWKAEGGYRTLTAEYYRQWTTAGDE